MQFRCSRCKLETRPRVQATYTCKTHDLPTRVTSRKERERETERVGEAGGERSRGDRGGDKPEATVRESVFVSV